MLRALSQSIRAYRDQLLQSQIIRRLVKNSGYLLSATGVSAALSMVQGILTARLLGVANYGLLGSIMLFTSVINKFASFRMSELVIKYIGKHAEDRNDRQAAAVFKAASLAEILASVLAYTLIWYLAPLGATYLAKDASLVNLFRLYGVIVLANLIAESSTGLLQIFDRYRKIASLGIVQSIVSLLLITITFLLKGDMQEILIAYIAGKVVSASGLTFLAWQEAKRQWGAGWWRVPLGLLRPQARELAHFAVSTNLSASLNLVNKDSELLWVSFFRGPLETGYYRLALTLANLLQMPVSPLPQATYPELSREVARQDWPNVSHVLREGSRMAGLYTVTASLVLALGGTLIIRYFYGADYLPAYPALIILLLGFLAANFFYWNRIALLALGHPDFPTRVNLALAAVKVAGILLLVPRFGYLANAALLAGYYIFSVGINAWKTGQILRQKAQHVTP
ncbi:MAG TPA: oligosaccharide flippase family protein [Anaerolineales bacterium]|nr:oligosaccharide flippase family protein [Anaerolineales bacterium]